MSFDPKTDWIFKSAELVEKMRKMQSRRPKEHREYFTRTSAKHYGGNTTVSEEQSLYLLHKLLSQTTIANIQRELDEGEMSL